jgi:hypothetical protein
MQSMPITRRIFGERGRRRAVSLGIDPARLPPGQSPTLKWLSGLQVLEHDELGFWEQNGYHQRGDPWHEQRR